MLKLRPLSSLETTPTIYYADPLHEISVKKLPAEIYKQALAAMILVCTDALIIDPHSKKVYLARRRHRPMRNHLWFIGGRRFPGETSTESIKRCLNRETSLKLPDRRFVYVDEYEYLFEDREQKPENAGTHSLSHTFAVFLKPEEILLAARTLDPEEYFQEDGLMALDRLDFNKLGVHEAIADVYDRVMSSSCFRLSGNGA